jgi:hypothetical protein
MAGGNVKHTFKKIIAMPSMVTHACNPTTPEAEIRKFIVPGQPREKS